MKQRELETVPERVKDNDKGSSDFQAPRSQMASSLIIS